MAICGFFYLSELPINSCQHALWKKYKKSKPFNLDMIYPVFFPRSGHFISAIIFSGRMNIDIIVFLC